MHQYWWPIELPCRQQATRTNEMDMRLLYWLSLSSGAPIRMTQVRFTSSRTEIFCGFNASGPVQVSSYIPSASTNGAISELGGSPHNGKYAFAATKRAKLHAAVIDQVDRTLRHDNTKEIAHLMTFAHSFSRSTHPGKGR